MIGCSGVMDIRLRSEELLILVNLCIIASPRIIGSCKLDLISKMSKSTTRSSCCQVLISRGFTISSSHSKSSDSFAEHAVEKDTSCRVSKHSLIYVTAVYRVVCCTLHWRTSWSTNLSRLRIRSLSTSSPWSLSLQLTLRTRSLTLGVRISSFLAAIKMHVAERPNTISMLENLMLNLHIWSSALSKMINARCQVALEYLSWPQYFPIQSATPALSPSDINIGLSDDYWNSSIVDRLIAGFPNFNTACLLTWFYTS